MPSVQRRFNSTGRLRIPRRNVVIELEAPAGAGSVPVVSARLDLSGISLPGSADVCLEAYYRTSSMRFTCGTVAHLLVPTRMELTDIDHGGAIQFRLLVIAADGSGRILAVANGLRPITKDDGFERDPLLPLRETDLGNELWRLDVDYGNGPTLLVNSAIPGLAAQLRTSALLQGLILPHALGMTLQKLAAIGEDDAERDWSRDWRRFLRDLGMPDEPDDPKDPESQIEWIEEAMRRFSDLREFGSRVRLSAIFDGHDD